MSKFRVSKHSSFRGQEINSKYNFLIGIEDNLTGDAYECTIEDFFELASVVKEFADELKQTEIEETRKHIAALEERLEASKKVLKQLEQL